MLFETPETPGRPGAPETSGAPGAPETPAAPGAPGPSEPTTSETSLPGGAGALDRAELGRRIAIGGGVAMILASFLPWVRLTAPFLGTLTRSGIDAGDGYVSLLLGAAVILLATVWRTQEPMIMVVAGAIAVVFALYEWVDIASGISDLEEEFVVASIGFGIPLLALGSASATAGAVMIHRSR